MWINQYNDWMITVEEFKRSLDELYKHHYILIDPHDAYDFNSKPNLSDFFLIGLELKSYASCGSINM
jgi:hypothetical protein